MFDFGDKAAQELVAESITDITLWKSDKLKGDLMMLQEKEDMLCEKEDDHCIFELLMKLKDMYNQSRKAVGNADVIIMIYGYKLISDIQVAPEEGTVTFGSSMHGCRPDAKCTAGIYAAEMGADSGSVM